MAHNRFWRLDARPQGHDFASALSLCTEPLAPLGDGEVRIAAEYLSMDAGTRMWMSPRTDGYQPPLPLGAKMMGVVLGRVSESRDPRFAAGTLVRGFGQWAQFSTVMPDPAGLVAVDDDVAALYLDDQPSFENIFASWDFHTLSGMTNEVEQAFGSLASLSPCFHFS